MNNLQQLIMAALDHKGDMSGYDLSKLLKPMTNNSHQQVYRELGNLNKSGAVVYSDVAQTGKPDLKIYHSCSFAPVKPVLIPSDFSKSNGAYSLAQFDIVNGTTLCEEFIKELKELEQKYFKMV